MPFKQGGTRLAIQFGGIQESCHSLLTIELSCQELCQPPGRALHLRKVEMSESEIPESPGIPALQLSTDVHGPQIDELTRESFQTTLGQSLPLQPGPFDASGESQPCTPQLLLILCERTQMRAERRENLAKAGLTIHRYIESAELSLWIIEAVGPGAVIMRGEVEGGGSMSHPPEQEPAQNQISANSCAAVSTSAQLSRLQFRRT